ncbi:MAG: phosphatidylserine decarboxylase, partial [Pseudomonadota bacterium]
EITVKGLKWSLHELLDGSPFQDRFKGGTYIHMFLNVNDYHRYHVPVRGIVREARNIHGKVVSDVMLKPDGTLDDIIGPTFQFKQERGLVVIESPVGLVAVLPIGMAQVSSVNLTAEVGAELFKGQEFGYFAFGGSDIVVLFEAGRVNITAEADTHYKQGKTIATAIK